jgi:hypothetical protein
VGVEQLLVVRGDLLQRRVDLLTDPAAARTAPEGAFGRQPPGTVRD